MLYFHRCYWSSEIGGSYKMLILNLKLCLYLIGKDSEEITLNYPKTILNLESD